jgi:Domain of unknown function (DUF4516)
VKTNKRDLFKVIIFDCGRAFMSPARQYVVTFVAGLSSLLAGASVVHTVFKPKTTIDVEELLAKRRAEEEARKKQ